MDKFKSLNMCDFCSKEIATCGAKIIKAHEIGGGKGSQLNPDSVVSCDGYKSPVDVLKKNFH